jgi:16S rRNA (cytosine967-C5)-methyltransferase
MVERWNQFYGEEVALKICEYDQSAPRTALRLQNFHPLQTAREVKASAASTTIEVIQLDPGKLLSTAAIVTRGDISQTDAFRNHELVIQDEGSQLVALVVGRGNNILDCCAAPGGKTRIMAQENPGATVVAMELHPRRAALLKKLISEPNVMIIAADARAIPFDCQFDRILVDAPCSGTGTLARNPEIKWRLTREDLTRLQAYQLEILSVAMKQVAPGERIVYSTCSLEPEENQQVVEKAMAINSGFRIVHASERLSELSDSGELAWRDIDSLLDGRYLRTIPGLHPCDGFFAAILERADLSGPRNS